MIDIVLCPADFVALQRICLDPDVGDAREALSMATGKALEVWPLVGPYRIVVDWKATWSPDPERK